MPRTDRNKSLLRLYLGALGATRRSFDRSTRFDSWQSEPCVVAPDPNAYQRYASLIGLQNTDHLLPTWFYVLAQRAVLAALTDSRFPFPATGMVHLANSIAVERPPERRAALTLVLDVTYGDLTSAGHRVELVARYEQRDALIATNTMSALVRCPAANRARNQSVRQAARLNQIATLNFASDIGRRYARVSGDYNPIHLWPWSARLFGFPRPIAHGMYSAGRVAALLAAEGIAIERQLDVRFLKPAFLPSEAKLGCEPDGATTHFELVADDGRLLLRGSAQ